MTTSVFSRLACVCSLALLCAPGCGSDDAPAAAAAPVDAGSGPVAIIDLRADTNRDGVVELTGEADDQGEDVWDAARGAIFLANIDDDLLACPKEGTDRELAACNDAADEVINGEDDLLDLARIRTVPWPDAPDDAQATIAVSAQASPFVRLFRKQQDGSFAVVQMPLTLEPDELRLGVELAIEGRDIVRDAGVWDGFLDATLSVKFGFMLEPVVDTVRMRMSPVITQHHLQPVNTAYVTLLQDYESQVFRADFAAAVEAAQVPGGLVELDDVADLDQWIQDFFEAAYMSMPAAGGKQHVIRVFYRSANIYTPWFEDDPLRAAGKLVFSHFRGKDVAGVQQYDLHHSEEMDSLDSLGNTETIPPYGDYPLGRLMRGNAMWFHPDITMTTLLESQRVQPPVYMDTSWLLVGHIDETLSFVKADSPRGWVLLANDPRLAKKMLEEQVAKGNGAVKMFVGKKWLNDDWSESPAEVTIQQALDDTDVMSESANAAVGVDGQLAKFKKETGITDAEIVPVPFLHYPAYGYSLAWQPGTVNATYLADGHLAAPDPHGPMLEGKDIFKTQLEQALQPFGITVHWVENWDLYHRLEGEVHCGSNVMREVTGPAWWESGR